MFAGFFLALLFAVGFGSLLLQARRSPREASAARRAKTELDSRLAPTVRELNALRLEAIKQVKARSITRVPIGVVAAIALWVLCQWNDDPPGLFGLIMFVVVGALGGEMWAVHNPSGSTGRYTRSGSFPNWRLASET